MAGVFDVQECEDPVQDHHTIDCTLSDCCHAQRRVELELAAYPSREGDA